MDNPKYLATTWYNGNERRIVRAFKVEGATPHRWKVQEYGSGHLSGQVSKKGMTMLGKGWILRPITEEEFNTFVEERDRLKDLATLTMELQRELSQLRLRHSLSLEELLEAQKLVNTLSNYTI